VDGPAEGKLLLIKFTAMNTYLKLLTSLALCWYYSSLSAFNYSPISYREPVTISTNYCVFDSGKYEDFSSIRKEALSIYRRVNSLIEDSDVRYSMPCYYCLDNKRLIRKGGVKCQAALKISSTYVDLFSGESKVVRDSDGSNLLVFETRAGDGFLRILSDGSYVKAYSQYTAGDKSHTKITGVYIYADGKIYAGEMSQTGFNSKNPANRRIRPNGVGTMIIKNRSFSSEWSFGRRVSKENQICSYTPPPPQKVLPTNNCDFKPQIQTLIKSFAGETDRDLVNIVSQEQYQFDEEDLYSMIEVSSKRAEILAVAYEKRWQEHLVSIKKDLEEYKTAYFEFECTTLGKLQKLWVDAYKGPGQFIKFRDPQREIVRVGLVNRRTRERFNLYFYAKADSGSSFGIIYPDLLNDFQ
jgi:hypothetical protein